MNPNIFNLLKVEDEIKKFLIINPDDIDLSRFKQNLSTEQLKDIEELFHQRKTILNKMFDWNNPDNLQRYETINRYLEKLTIKLKERVDILNGKVHLLCDDTTFDDDYEIYGTLQYSYNEENSVLTLPDDDFYKSDFPCMIKAIHDYYDDNSLFGKNIVHLFPTAGSEYTDALINWSEAPLPKHIYASYATHVVVSHTVYSIPDLLRLNDFWCEVHFIEQNITDQTGKRYKSGKINKLS